MQCLRYGCNHYYKDLQQSLAYQSDEPDYSKLHDYHTVQKEASSMQEVYQYAVPRSDAVQMNDEQKIYDTPCEDTGDYGPIYTEPPTVVEKIYETFEGKRFRKLYHQNIRYL